MQKFWTKISIVALALILAGWAAYPPEKSLRLGKDLRGGVTLVYSVEVRADESPRDVLGSVIDVLKDRVDPEGLLDISMVPQGRDRIEITMPLPGDKVKAKRAELDAALSAIDTNRLRARDVNRAMGLSGVERDEALATLAGPDAELLAELQELAVLADRTADLRRQYDENEDPAEEIRLATEANAAAIEFENKRAEVVGDAVTSEQIRRALQLSNRVRRLYDPDTRESVELPSPRSSALERLRQAHPGQADAIDAVVAIYEEYEAIRTTLDDASDLERLLRASGVFSFRITVDPGVNTTEETALRAELRENGPRSTTATDKAWFKINKIDNWYNNVAQMRGLEADPVGFFSGRGYIVEEYDGEYYMLCWDARGSMLTPNTSRNWRVARAYQGVDQIGRPAINFQMDARGAQLLGEMTEAHVQDKMAILLDDEVYTAPELNSRISRSGQIMGDFTPAELAYIIRVMNSGSLQNKLSPAPISRNQIGPEFGLDYLRQGLNAGMIALLAISIFMVLYYFRCGLIAVFALACNGFLLLGVMSAMHATFTLPGIAGIILTFGMAVDSNVLIFERIREELRAGRDTRAAVRLGFSKAMSSIVDGNVTNLIVCLVLANIGTQEIKGFAITLGVGVLTTMFSALVLSRLIFDLLLEFKLFTNIRMLPSAMPSLERAFEPSVNWLKLRWGFIVISTVYVGVGLGMVFLQRGEMMDTEFRGGTQVTLQFMATPDETDDPETRLTLKRKEVEDRVIAITEGLATDDALIDLRNAEILPLDPQSDGLTSDKFMIKSVVTDEESVINAITLAFEDMIDSRPPLVFTGIDQEDLAGAPVYPLINPRGVLGPDIGRPEYFDDVTEYAGGAAVLLENLDPPPTKWGLEARLAKMREQPDFTEAAGRQWEVRVLEGTDSEVRTAVVLVSDPDISFMENQAAWDTAVGEVEWDLIRAALTQTTTLASVQNFSPAMARSFQAKAAVAVALSLLLILIYVWVRFGSVRYSMAAIACLAHDCLTAIGLIALAEILTDWSVTANLATNLGIRPFKIDLNMIAALLTIIGYSLNDTIIVMDRIREMKGRLPYATDIIINRSINMTISRTVITSGTTLLAIFILYSFGGEGVRGFSYAMLIGVGVGTYSSIAVAAPLIWQRRHTEMDDDGDALAPPASEGEA